MLIFVSLNNSIAAIAYYPCHAINLSGQIRREHLFWR